MDNIDVIKASSKPVSSEFNYVYSEDANKAFVKIPKETLRQLLKRVDSTLTVADEAAEAKATGNAIKAIRKEVDEIERPTDEQIALIEAKGAETLASIPSDYTELYNIAMENKKSKAGAIICSASGKEIVVTDSDDNVLHDFTLNGKGVQNGEPTPVNPIEIKNVGKYNPETGKYEVEVTASSKNSLEITENSITEKGITFTVNDDRSVTANGTATENVWFVTNSNFKLPKGRYRMHGCPNGGSNSTYATQLYKVDSTGQIVQITDEYGQGVIFDITESSTLEHDIVIRKGITVNNLVFYPMITFECVTDLTFEKYKGFVTETLESSQPFRGSKDGTVRDSRSFDGDVRRIASIDKNTPIKSIEMNPEEGIWRIVLEYLEVPYNGYVEGLCTHYPVANSYIEIYNATTPMISVNANGNILIKDSSLTTEDEVTSLLSNGFEFAYPLKTPIIEPLSETELAKLKRLQTFNPTTIITNSDDGEMEIEYVADTKIYIDNKFKVLETALANTNAQLL